MTQVTKLTREKLFVMAVLFGCVTKGFPILSLDIYDPTSTANDTTLLRLVWIPIYVIMLWLAARQFRPILRAFAAHPLILMLTVLPALSALWSIDAGDTMRRAVALLICSTFGVYLGIRFRWVETLYLLALVLGAVMGVSLLFAIAPGRIGVMWYPEDVYGSWRGAFTHKNELGLFCGMNVAILVVMGRWLVSFRKLRWWDLLLTIFLLLMSNSKTSLFNTMIVVMVGYLISMARSKGGIGKVMVWGVALCLLAAVILPNLDEVLGVFGRDTTFTGRTELWDAVMDAIADNAVIGYGYQAFWINLEGPALVIWDAVGWHAPTAHDGYLDLTLSLGLVGLTAFVASYLIALFRSLARVRGPDREGAYWRIMFLVLFGIFNFSESHILEQNDIFWILYVAVVTSLWRHAPISERRHRFVPDYRVPAQRVAQPSFRNG